MKGSRAAPGVLLHRPLIQPLSLLPKCCHFNTGLLGISKFWSSNKGNLQSLDWCLNTSQDSLFMCSECLLCGWDQKEFNIRCALKDILLYYHTFTLQLYVATQIHYH